MASAEPGHPNPSSPPTSALLRTLRLWFAFEDPVGRRTYIVTGVALMAMKYLLELSLVYFATGNVWSPLTFLSPIYSLRMHEMQAAPDWVVLVLVLMTLPFMWVGVSMSVRRAVDAGLTAWFGVLFLVPLMNYVAMVVLSAVKSKAGKDWSPPSVGPYRTAKPRGADKPEIPIDSGLKSALLGLACAVGLGLSMVGVSVYALELYGTSLFFATPFVMGAMSAFFYNRPFARPVGATMGVALLGTLLAGAALLLFALEGLVCLFMAFPIAGGIACLGALLGRAIALQSATPMSHALGFLIALPGAAGAEAAVMDPPLFEVVSTIEIDAPPERVWPNVIGFSELDAPSELLFRTGIAYPMRARIEGSGVGAIRHCEFSTGAFVEPITTWDEPRRLSFAVTEQPPAMKEWSPFQHVHPPHLDASIRSKRGEFRLVALDGGRTRLEGSTWYELSMAPEVYWKLWSDGMIHAIHTRVLLHIKDLTENPTAAP